MSEFSDEIERTIRDALRDSPAAHKRRVAIRLGLREPHPAGCDHAAHWDHVKQWCDGCGITKEELFLAAGDPPARAGEIG